MRLDLLPLLMTLLILFFRSSTSAITRQQLLRYLDLVAVTKDDCHNQCQGKHGFFKDANGEYQPTSVGESYYFKCKCMVSKELKEHIKATLGEKILKTYERYNNYWKTQWGRDALHDYAEKHQLDNIEFITFKQMMEITEERKKEELTRQLSAARKVELTRQASETRKAADLNRQLMESREEAAGLRAELTEKRNEIVQINQNLQETRTDAADLRRQLSETKETVRRIEADSTTKLAQFNEQLEKSMEEVRTLNAQLKERVNEAQGLARQLQESKKEAHNLNRELSQQKTEINRLNQELTDARQEAATSKSKIQELTAKLNKRWWKSSCCGGGATGSSKASGKKKKEQKPTNKGGGK